MSILRKALEPVGISTQVIVSVLILTVYAVN